MKSCSITVPPLSLSAASVWTRAYQSILFTPPFGEPFCGPGLSSAPFSPPSRHNHTCLILSNLSFILANQLPRCALFQPLALLWFNYILPTLCSYSMFPLFLHLYLVVLPHPLPFPVMASGSILTRPSARAQTNQSRVVLFHKDQKQLVSSHISRFFLVCLCCPICLPSPRMPAWLFSVFYIYELLFVLHDSLNIFILSGSHTLGFKHGCNQGRFILHYIRFNLLYFKF